MNRTMTALDDEWSRIVDSPTSRSALEQWGRTEPALAGCTTLAEMLGRRRSDTNGAQALLAALARLAPTDKLAARTLLQALVPGLLQLASTSCADDPLAMDELVSLAWERIRTYPPTRSGSVAANVLLDARKRYRRHRTIENPREGAVDDPIDPPAPSVPSAEDVVVARLAADDVVAACREAVSGDAAFTLIVRTRLEDVPLEVAAAEQFTTVKKASCIRWRAERRLRTVLPMVS